MGLSRDEGAIFAAGSDLGKTDERSAKSRHFGLDEGLSNKEGPPPFGSSPSIVEPRSLWTASSVASRRCPRKGKHPGHMSRRPRRKTMRHWITSFRLLLG